MKFGNVLGTFLSIIISLISLYFAYDANQTAKRAVNTSKDANELAKEANEISKESNILAMTNSSFDFQKSSAIIVDEAYDSIYKDKILREVRDGLEGDKKVGKKDLGDIIDIFENLGSKYCKGLVDTEMLRASFSKTLFVVCNNDQVYEIFHNRKNGAALLCNQFIPDSKFGETFRKETLNTCKF